MKIISIKKHTFVESLESAAWIFYMRKLIYCPHCDKIGYFVLHDFIYKIDETTNQKEITGKRFWCSPKGNNSGCGRTVSILFSKTIFNKWYFSIVLWTFFLLHYIKKKTIAHSYHEATGTKDPRNGYRWLRLLKKNIPSIKEKIPPPENQITHGNNIGKFLEHFYSQFDSENPFFPFQYAFQTHALE
jgi:hypothetical protein